jgi:hypothetical protein
MLILAIAISHFLKNISPQTRLLFTFLFITMGCILVFLPGKLFVNNLNNNKKIIPRELKFCSIFVWLSGLIIVSPILVKYLRLNVYIPTKIQMLFLPFPTLLGMYFFIKGTGKIWGKIRDGFIKKRELK